MNELVNNLKEPKRPDKFTFEHLHSFSSLAAPKIVLLRKFFKNFEDEYVLMECSSAVDSQCRLIEKNLKMSKFLTPISLLLCSNNVPLLPYVLNAT